MQTMYHHVQVAKQIVLVALISSTIVGCGEVNVRPTLTAETVVAAEQGIVVARFVDAGGTLLPFNQLTIAPKNVNESSSVKPDRLIAIDKDSDGNSVFAAPVDAGSYALSSFRAFHVIGEYIYDRFVAVDATFGTFQIRPGEVTDLGTIVFYLKPVGDKYEEVLVRVPGTSNGEVLDAYLPFQSYQPNRLLTWDDDGLESDRQSLYVSVVQSPTEIETVYEAPDGTILFLAPLGVILERDPSGNWSTDAVDTNLQMFAVAQSETGDRAVAGSEGQIFFRPAGGSKWQDISLGKDKRIDSLEFASDGQLIALVRTYNTLSVKKRSTAGAWTDINRYKPNRGWEQEESSKLFVRRRATEPRRLDAATFSEFEGRRYVEIGMRPTAYNRLASMKTRLFEYDPQTYLMKGVDKPKKVLFETDAGALKLAVKEAGIFSWRGQPTYLRSDAQAGWVELNTQIRTCYGVQWTSKPCSDATKPKRKALRFTSAPWFRDENNGVALARVDVPLAGEEDASSMPRILITEDGGANWTLTDREVPSRFCGSLIPQVDDRLLLSCRGANGDFFESTDDGASWTQVREHQDF
jgi:photosystem II stability/assembly factor-like uncharacterized protein